MTGRLIALCTLAAVACKEDAPTLEGQVTDIWGGSIAEATILVEGSSERLTTDAHGYFSLENPAASVALRVGKEGYIQDELTLTAGEAGTHADAVVELYPRPSEHGFFIVGQTGYQRVDPESVRVIGNELSKVSGLRAVNLRAGRTPFEVVFETELRMEEVSRLGLELHTLSYSAQVEVAGPFGTEQADANLYTSQGTVPLEITPMRSRNAYRIVATEPLEPGWYAFQIQDVLDPNNAAHLETLPEAQKVAWAFEYKP